MAAMLTEEQYMKWCKAEWDRNHLKVYHAGDLSLNEWAAEWLATGAVGTFDILRENPTPAPGRMLAVFGHVIPATAEEIAAHFSEGLAVAAAAGIVRLEGNVLLPTAKKKAPTSNTGLTSPPSAN